MKLLQELNTLNEGGLKALIDNIVDVMTTEDPKDGKAAIKKLLGDVKYEQVAPAVVKHPSVKSFKKNQLAGVDTAYKNWLKSFGFTDPNMGESLEEGVDEMTKLKRALMKCKAELAKCEEGDPKCDKLKKKLKDIKKKIKDCKAMSESLTEAKKSRFHGLDAVGHGKSMYDGSHEFTDDLVDLMEMTEDIKQLLGSQIWQHWLKLTDENYDVDALKAGKEAFKHAEQLVIAVHNLNMKIDEADQGKRATRGDED